MPEAEQRWRAVLQSEGLGEDDVEALAPLGLAMGALGETDLQRLVEGLVRLREAMDSEAGAGRYGVSARYLLGSSKLLDALPSRALRAFGVDPDRFAGPPSYVVVAGPPDPERVILVENPQALEAAVAAVGTDRIAWVATFGYGLSASGEEYGRQLASMMEGAAGKLITLIRGGNPPAVQALLKHPVLRFWGDLDREGLRIYWRLRACLPQLQLSGLYSPMVALCEAQGAHHPYANVVAKENQGLWDCDDPVVGQLLAVCGERAVDQEALGADTTRDYASTDFHWADLDYQP